MSAQCGIWSFDQPVDRDLLERMRRANERCGPDESNNHIIGQIGMSYCAFHTTKESWLENQPYIFDHGLALTWDGRLDNREELLDRLNLQPSTEQTDVAIVAAAYQHWNTACFKKLVGDWALALWDERQRMLILAKDFVGTRHLYYQFRKDRLLWSTLLDPLILLAESPLKLNEEYVAGYFALYPAAHLTPYQDIFAVPPGSFITLHNATLKLHEYWSFDCERRIRYRNDVEYEEHFRHVFSEAVRRRLRSDSPVLAELSGGMDSSSIVCMADKLIRECSAETPRLDTISYYDDKEPNWNEMPFFMAVEEQRGQQGTHLDLTAFSDSWLMTDPAHFFATPGLDRRALQFSDKISSSMKGHNNRVLLSGRGGDEFLGGVPTPIPELADLVTEGNLRTFFKQLYAWGSATRQPFISLAAKTLFAFSPKLPLICLRTPQHFLPWLTPTFVKKYQTVFDNITPRLHFVGPSPSQQSLLNAIAGLQNQLAFLQHVGHLPCEYRYPYADYNLLEFMFSIPRAQVLRPGQRRALMRRSLVDIVPSTILQRRRKAFVVRRPLAHLEKNWDRLASQADCMALADMGIIDKQLFMDRLHAARHGDHSHLLPLLKTFMFELWLKNLLGRKLLHLTVNTSRIFPSEPLMATHKVHELLHTFDRIGTK